MVCDYHFFSLVCVVCIIQFYSAAYKSINLTPLLTVRNFAFCSLVLFGQNCPAFFFGWEMMGFFSFCLISWFNGRCLSGNGSSLAFIGNRIRDFLLFCVLLNGCNLTVLTVAGLSKGAIWIFSSWLSTAMEGPTPVSTLLHSSIMSASRVLLVRMLNYVSVPVCLILIGYGCYMARRRIQFSDYKFIIAYSTSNLFTMTRLVSMMGTDSVSLSYSLIDGLLKFLLVLLCGWLTHANYVQHTISKYNYQFLRSSVFWCCRFMCGLPFCVGFELKDLIVLGSVSLMIYFIFLVYACRTFSYGVILGDPVPAVTLNFLESGHILVMYAFYILLSAYVCELPSLGAEWRRMGVFTPLYLFFLLPLLSIRLAYYVDLFYKIKRLNIFGIIGMSQSGQYSKNWAVLLSLLFLLLYF